MTTKQLTPEQIERRQNTTRDIGKVVHAIFEIGQRKHHFLKMFNADFINECIEDFVDEMETKTETSNETEKTQIPPNESNE